MINYDIEEFCCPTCLAMNAINAMLETQELSNDDYSSVAILCKEDLAEELLKLFCNIEINGFEFNIEYINFDKIDYDKEYAVTIDTDGTLCVEKAYFDDGEMMIFGEDLIFVSDECNCKLFINQADFCEDNVIAFSINENE